METAAFLKAIQAGQTGQVQGMLDQDPALAHAQTENGLSAVLLAAYYGQPHIASLVAERRADLTIFEACVVGNLARVQSLAAADPSLVNAFSADGYQPLGLSAFFSQPAVAHFLVAQGAQVNSPSSNAQKVTPLISATASTSLEIARLLLEHGADPNARQSGGFSSMHNAAQNGQIEMLEILLAHGGDLNARADDGQTPLTFAIQAGHEAAVAWLRARGAVE